MGVGAALLHADGHMTNLIDAFRNFTNAPKNVYSLIHLLQLSGDNGLENFTVNTDIIQFICTRPSTVIPYVCPPDVIPFHLKPYLKANSPAEGHL